MKIFIVTGRTGGHFFPAVTFSKVFKQQYPDSEIHYIYSEKTLPNISSEENSVFNEGEIHSFPYFPWKGFKGLYVFRFMFSLVKAFLISLKLLKTQKADLVVGFGSYLCFPVLLAAFFKGIPTVIHEQNRTMGKANRLISYFVDKIAVSFCETKFEFNSTKLIWTGNIIRQQLMDKLNLQGRSVSEKEGFHILVLGGSQGSFGVNKTFVHSLPYLDKGFLGKLKVTHITGESNFVWVGEQYQQLGLNPELVSYAENIEDYYQKADLVVCRAGAGTLFELVLYQKPSILIPYPYAGQHQLANAQVLAEARNAWIYDETLSKPEDFADILKVRIQNPSELEAVEHRMKNFLKIDGGEKLVQLAISLIKSTTPKEEISLQT